MTEDLLNIIQEKLRLRWEGRLPRILDRARKFALVTGGRFRASSNQSEVEKAIREAYSAGYREGYWEGVLDVLESGTRHECATPSTQDPFFLVH